jgi:uncharacterized membrane protein YdjX (TVP38/TMEM64 family)
MLPAFAPPTWSIIVLFKFNNNLNTALLVIVGATASTLGRTLLALGTRKLARFIPIDTRENLTIGGAYLESKMQLKWLWFLLFAVSPFPSAQLFEAAGLLSLNLKRIAIAFFSGRLITYSIYGFGAAALKKSSWGEIISTNIKSPWGIALQVLLLIGVYLLTKIDWKSKVRDLNNGNHSV